MDELQEYTIVIKGHFSSHPRKWMGDIMWENLNNAEQKYDQEHRTLEIQAFETPENVEDEMNLLTRIVNIRRSERPV